MDAKSVNKVILVGNIGKTPECRYTSSGAPVTSFSLATNETLLDADGKKVNNTEWHNIVTWNKLAEFSKEYLKKGQCIYMEGKIRTSSWEDKEGNKTFMNEPHERAQLFKDRAKMGAHLGGNWEARRSSMKDSVNFLLENIN